MSLVTPLVWPLVTVSWWLVSWQEDIEVARVARRGRVPDLRTQLYCLVGTLARARTHCMEPALISSKGDEPVAQLPHANPPSWGRCLLLTLLCWGPNFQNKKPLKEEITSKPKTILTFKNNISVSP